MRDKDISKCISVYSNKMLYFLCCIPSVLYPLNREEADLPNGCLIIIQL